MLDSERTLNLKSTDSSRNFAYVSSYWHLKNFAWKRDCPISSKPQMSRSWWRPFLKALIGFSKLNLSRNTKTICLYFKGCWILAYIWHSNCHNFNYILGRVAKLHFSESPQKSFKRHQHLYISIEPPITK